jgi:2-polyprenyl-3-methyl-5-hydroxy-6-metoxy-1,4-benzoquinol methylase
MKIFEKCPVCNGNELKKVFQKKWAFSSFTKCSGCRLIFQNPQEDAKKTVGRYGKEYFEYERNNQYNFFKLIELTLNEFDMFKIIPYGANILEIGCATGLFLKYMKEKGYNPVGVEICKESADYGKDIYGVNILNCTLDEAPFDGKFSFIHFSHLIEHLNDPVKFLKIVYDLLEDDGYAMITTPNSSGLFASIFDENWRCIVDDHLFLFNKDNLGILLKKSGFKVRKILTWGGIPSGKAVKPLKNIADKFVKAAGIGDVVCFLVSK